jgi:hypothetical protein
LPFDYPFLQNKLFEPRIDEPQTSYFHDEALYKASPGPHCSGDPPTGKPSRDRHKQISRIEAYLIREETLAFITIPQQ